MNIKELIIPIAVILVIVWRSIVKPLLKNKMSEDQFKDLIYYTEKMVKLAEVIFNSPGSGQAKKKWVLDKINEYTSLTGEELSYLSHEIDKIVDRLYNS